MNNRELRQGVRDRYGSIARQDGLRDEPRSGCCGNQSSCCGSDQGMVESSAKSQSLSNGYSPEEMATVPTGANLGLGCGNPVALAALQPGNTVLDLGSGAGFDCFLAARKVGETGQVIGVDMTPDMVEKARENAEHGGYTNVEFRLGEIENLPVADSSIDLIISNCVINLSVNKARVFAEAFRVLKTGGKLMISDIVLLRDLPEKILESIEAYAACVAGAALREDYLELLRAAGFHDIEVLNEKAFGSELPAEDPQIQILKEEQGLSSGEVAQAAADVVSISVTAIK